MHFQNSFRCIFQLPNNEVKHRIEPRQISAFFDMFFSKVTREVQQLIGRKLWHTYSSNIHNYHEPMSKKNH